MARFLAAVQAKKMGKNRKEKQKIRLRKCSQKQIEGHLWQPDRNWGYIGFQTPEEVIAKYEEFAAMLADTVDEGVSAAVYTQTTDVEIEVNGLMTYDRIPKLDTARLRKANQAVIERLK